MGSVLLFSLNFILYLSLKKKKKHSHTPTTRSLTTNKNKNIPLKTIPASMGLCLELAYPITSYSESRDDSMDSAPFRHQLPLNSFIDSILRTVYHAPAPAPPPPTDPHGARRQIIFTSSSPDACAAVNWKQPNCQSRLSHRYFFFLSFPLSHSSSFYFYFYFSLSLFWSEKMNLKKAETLMFFPLPSPQIQSYSRHRAAKWVQTHRAPRQQYEAKRR